MNPTDGCPPDVAAGPIARAIRDHMTPGAESTAVPATSPPCACGIPNRANVHVSVVLGRDVDGGTETTSTDIYVCTDHWTGNARDLLAWDGHEVWEIVETDVTHLR